MSASEQENALAGASNNEQEIPSLLSDYDLYLFGQGKHYQIYEKMGAHARNINGVMGTNFATWAPNALAISVIGDFNDWRRNANPMHLRHHELGVWECFVPGVQIGAQYKFAIYSRVNNYTVDKTDPYGFASELRPKTASIVTDIHQHTCYWSRSDEDQFLHDHSRRKNFIAYEGDYNGGLRFNRSFFDRIISVSTHRNGHAAKSNSCKVEFPRVQP